MYIKTRPIEIFKKLKKAILFCFFFEFARKTLKTQETKLHTKIY